RLRVRPKRAERKRRMQPNAADNSRVEPIIAEFSRTADRAVPLHSRALLVPAARHGTIPLGSAPGTARALAGADGEFGAAGRPRRCRRRAGASRAEPRGAVPGRRAGEAARALRWPRPVPAALPAPGAVPAPPGRGSGRGSPGRRRPCRLQGCSRAVPLHSRALLVPAARHGTIPLGSAPGTARALAGADGEFGAGLGGRGGAGAAPVRAVRSRGELCRAGGREGRPGRCAGPVRCRPLCPLRERCRPRRAGGAGGGLRGGAAPACRRSRRRGRFPAGSRAPSVPGARAAISGGSLLSWFEVLFGNLLHRFVLFAGAV
ncbi:unnamed protein product, partial [Coccothraustes coccothraustes]